MKLVVLIKRVLIESTYMKVRENVNARAGTLIRSNFKTLYSLQATELVK